MTTAGMWMMTETPRLSRRFLSITIIRRETDWLAHLTCNPSVQASADTDGGAIGALVLAYPHEVHQSLQNQHPKEVRQ